MIWIEPERMNGAACFMATRVPVQNLLDNIEGGSTNNEFFENYPSVSRDQVVQVLELGREHLIERVSS